MTVVHVNAMLINQWCSHATVSVWV